MEHLFGGLSFLEAGITKMVFSSSCATYGVSQELPITEDHAQVPINPHGASQLFVEITLHWYVRAYGLRYINLRYFNAAGAEPDREIGVDHAPETHLIPLVIAAALGANSSVEIFGTDNDTADGTAARDYVHVCDLATARVKSVDQLLAGGQSASVNLSTGRGHSIREVISSVEADSRAIVTVVEARAGGATRRRSLPIRNLEKLCCDGNRQNRICRPSCALRGSGTGKKTPPTRLASMWEENGKFERA